MLGEAGLEPASLTAYAPEAYVFANFTTRPYIKLYNKKHDLKMSQIVLGFATAKQRNSMIIKKVLQNTLVGFLLRLVVVGVYVTDGSSILSNTIDDRLGKSPRRIIWLIAIASSLLGIILLGGAQLLFVNGQLFSAGGFVIISLSAFWLFLKSARKL